MKRNLIAMILAAVLISALLCGCSAKSPASDAPVSGADVVSDAVSDSDWQAKLTEADMPLVQVINMSVEAFNAGNLDAYMATIDPQSEVYEETKHDASEVFDKYRLSASIDSIRVISRDSTNAVVEVTQTTVREGEGKTFYKTQAVMEHTMVCRDGAWYIASTLVKSSTEITEAWELLEEFSALVSAADTQGE